MKKMFLMLAVAVIALASCSPSKMDVQPGTPAEAAQNLFSAIKDKNFDKAADWVDVSEAPGADISSDIAAKAMLAQMELVQSTLGMTEVYAVSEKVEGDKADVELYINTAENGSGSILVKCKKIDGEWKAAADFELKE